MEVIVKTSRNNAILTIEIVEIILEYLYYSEKLRFIEYYIYSENSFTDNSKQKKMYLFDRLISNSKFKEIKEINLSNQFIICNCFHLFVLSYLLRNRYSWNENTCYFLVERKKYNLLKLCIDNGCPINERTSCEIMRRGNIDLLKWYKKNIPLCPLGNETFLVAVNTNNIDILNWWFDNDCAYDINSTIAYKIAIKNDNLEIVQLLRRKGFYWDASVINEAVKRYCYIIVEWCLKQDDMCPSDKNTCMIAASLGNLPMFQLLDNKNCTWGIESITIAARNRQYHIIEWCKYRRETCPWNVETTAIIASNGDLQMLEWCLKNNCPCNVLTINNAIIFKHFDLVIWCMDNKCPMDISTINICAEKGYLDLLIKCRENDCNWNVETVNRAVEFGHFELFKYCILKGCSWNEDTCERAGACGYLEILQWCVKNGCSWTNKTLESAIINNHFDILEWCSLQENCPSLTDDIEWCLKAVEHDNLDMLKWCRNQNPPLSWDHTICEMICYNDNLEMLIWCRTQNPPCPWNKEDLLANEEIEDVIKDWIREN